MPTQRTIFQRVGKALSGIAPRALGRSGEQGMFASIMGQGRTGFAKRGVPQFLKSFNELPWLRASVTKIASGIGGTEFLFLAEDPETEQMVTLDDLLTTNHPLDTFIKNPNPYFSWRTLLWMWSVHLELVGEAYGVWDNSSGVDQIWPVTPDKITQYPTLDEPYFLLQLENGSHEIPISQVLWLNNPDPASPYARGSGIAQSLDDELNTDEAAAKTISAFFQNRAIQPLLIYGAGLNAEGTKKLEEEWMDKQAGFFNAYKPYFLNRKVEIKELQQNLASSEFVELRKYERDTIIQVFGIPPEILGILQNSNRATIEAADLFFSRYTLLPRLEQIREQFQTQVVSRFDDTGLIEIDFVNPVQEDKYYELEVMKAFPFAFTLDQVRAKAGEDPLPDGYGEVHPTPGTLVYLHDYEISEGGAPPVTPEPVMSPAEPMLQPTEPLQVEPSEQPLMVPLSHKTSKVKYKTITTGKGYRVKVRR